MTLAREEGGAVLVEATVMMTIMLVFLLGSIDFLLVFYQWNLATKALQMGVRLASVSDPVAAGFDNLGIAIANSLPAGSEMPAFIVRCDGEALTCKCIGFCTGLGGYDEAAMDTIVFGRNSLSCSDATSVSNAGMCDIFPRITAANVTITYAQTGLGYVARPGGPAPTITIALQNLPIQFFFLGGLMKFNKINLTASTSAAGEDLSSRAPK